MSFSPLRKFTTALFIFSICGPYNEAFGFFAGAKSAGMGSVGIAYPQDSFAAALNPAGIMDVEDRIDLGAAWRYRHGEAEIKIKHTPGIQKCNGAVRPFHDNSSVDYAIGINKKVCFPVCQEAYSVGFGLIAYEKNHFKTSFKKPVALLGRSKTQFDYEHGVIAPVVSMRIAEDHNIGISFDFHFQRLNIKGLEQYKHPLYSAHPQHVTNRGYAYSNGFGTTIGWTWKAIDGLTIGVIYRTKTKMKRMDRYKGFIADNGKLDIPAEWGFGLTYQFMPCATITADFEWIQWSEIKAWNNPIVNRFKNNENEWQNKTYAMGSVKGPGFGYSDQFVYRIGIDYAIDPFWTIRAGYENTNTPTKKTQTMLNMLVCNLAQHTLSIGATYTINSWNEISAFFAHSFENTVDGKYGIPRSFGGGSVNLSESKEFLGVSWGLLY